LFNRISYTSFWGTIAGVFTVISIILHEAPAGLINKENYYVQWLSFLTGLMSGGSIWRAFLVARDSRGSEQKLQEKKIEAVAELEDHKPK
jgi:hypothetical protein